MDLRDSVLAAATLTVVAVTLRLGWWQLDRAAERQALHDALQARMSQPALELSGLASTVSQAEQQHFRVRDPDNIRDMQPAGRYYSLPVDGNAANLKVEKYTEYMFKDEHAYGTDGRPSTYSITDRYAIGFAGRKLSQIRHTDECILILDALDDFPRHEVGKAPDGRTQAAAENLLFSDQHIKLLRFPEYYGVRDRYGSEPNWWDHAHRYPPNRR